MTDVDSDTSPIRALAHLGRIELLRDLSGTVLVPPVVAEEMHTPPIGLPRVEILDLDFVSLHAPRDPERVAELLRTLDAGESEALVLAQELGASAVLIDEAAGRAMARRIGLLPIGVLGMLVRAKQRGDSSSLRAEILRMDGEA